MQWETPRLTLLSDALDAENKFSMFVVEMGPTAGPS